MTMSSLHEDVYYHVVPSRFGNAAVVWHYKKHTVKIVRILLPQPGMNADRRVKKIWSEASAHTDAAQGALCARLVNYLNGAKIVFNLDALDFSRVSSFQEKVLRMEHRVPYGRVTTYGRLAARVGAPGAARAVGNALARNPFPLIIPCHRVVRGDGSLGGFQGSLDLKRSLLEMEGVRFDETGHIPKRYFL